MKNYKIVFKDGRVVTDQAERIIDIIRKYDLATKENIGTKVYQL